MTYLEEWDDIYDEVVEGIRSNNLSRDNFPKLVLGTGLSAIYNLPGMKALALALKEEFNNCDITEIKEVWESKEEVIFKEGLEEGLSTINLNNPIENKFVDYVKTLTTKFILEKEVEKMNETYTKETGFKTLINYLKNTISYNNKILDIMTLNYDRTVEIICDSLKIKIINGFSGNIIRRFDINDFRNPNKKDFAIRLFKPHGSISWIKTDNEIIETNDNKKLLEECKDIHIITPGATKYEMCTTNYLFNTMRQTFEEVLENGINYSLLIFGYGFNDEHFNVTLYSKFNMIPTLIISKNVKDEVVIKAMENSNITLLYEENGKNYIIFNKEKYISRQPLWNIDVFSKVFLE